MKPNKSLMLLTLFFSFQFMLSSASSNEIDLAKMAESDAKLEALSDQEKIVQLQKDISQLKEWIASAKNQQSGLRGELALSEEDIERILKKIENVKQSIEQSEQQLAELQNQKKN